MQTKSYYNSKQKIPYKRQDISNLIRQILSTRPINCDHVEEFVTAKMTRNSKMRAAGTNRAIVTGLITVGTIKQWADTYAYHEVELNKISRGMNYE